MVPSPPTAMTAPASVVEVDDREDDLPLNSLRTVIGAQKIVDEKRKEEEALAAEPSLGFNDEWCKAHQDKVASSFKIQDLYGHMMPPQDGQEVATTITSELQSLCNARNDMNRIKDKTKEGHEAEEKKKQVNQALVKQMLKGDRKRKMAAAAAGGVAIMSPGATDDDLEEPESLDDCGNEGGKRPKRRNTLSIMEMREKNKKKKLELQELALEDKKQDRAAKRKKDEAQAKKDEAQAKLLEALVAKMTKENE